MTSFEQSKTQPYPFYPANTELPTVDVVEDLAKGIDLTKDQDTSQDHDPQARITTGGLFAAVRKEMARRNIS